MKAYLAGQDIALTIPLTDSDGVALSATAVEYRVSDQNGVDLVAKVALAGYMAGGTDAVVTVLAANNSVGAARRALRTVELFVTTAEGITVITTEYVIEASATIVIGVNSLQTYPAALLLGYEQPNLPAWNDASKIDRSNALSAAYRNLGRLTLRYINTDYKDQSRLVSPINSSYDITKMTAIELAALPVEYLEALCRAQVIEADFLLGSDEAGDIRRSGIMSASVGESSQFFRPAKPYEGAVCKRALKELARYIDNTVRLCRSS